MRLACRTKNCVGNQLVPHGPWFTIKRGSEVESIKRMDTPSLRDDRSAMAKIDETKEIKKRHGRLRVCARGEETLGESAHHIRLVLHGSLWTLSKQRFVILKAMLNLLSCHICGASSEDVSVIQLSAPGFEATASGTTYGYGS